MYKFNAKLVLKISRFSAYTCFEILLNYVIMCSKFCGVSDLFQITNFELNMTRYNVLCFCSQALPASHKE